MQELWEDKTIRLGVHGLREGGYQPENQNDTVRKIFKEGLRTSQQQKGTTDLKFTTLVQGNNTEFELLDALDYGYHNCRVYLISYSRRMFC